MSPMSNYVDITDWSVPRASGDEPMQTLTTAHTEECSPRERG